MTTEFKVGEKYTNDQIRFALNVENLGGIRPSVDAGKHLNHLVILTTTEQYQKNLSENPYHDRIENNVLIYTAQGRIGDQEITGRNRRIIEQYSATIPFYGFSNEGKQTYIFLGLLELLRHYQEYQIDKKNILRKVWVFEFYIHNEINIVPIRQAKDLIAAIFEDSRRIRDLDKEEREVVVFETPSEAFEKTGYETEEIRSHLLQINPYRFESLVRDVVESNGFTNVTVTPPSQDGGIDVNAYVLDSNYFFSKTHVQFQVKRWRHSVGSVEINNFRGALHTTAKGVFVTTSHFTKAAIQESEHVVKPCISLIDGFKFSKLIMDTGINLNKYF
ncbi:MAG: restriction endonuclease [Deltaproteobacteria bacterium]|nr:restriction endonuclease [Deltaproteobacteria bacterium]